MREAAEHRKKHFTVAGTVNEIAALHVTDLLISRGV